MKKITLGIFADVDAGKTTLSESMLFLSGTIRKAGRVDHGDSFLDNDSIERERGITVYSKPAVFSYGGAEFTLIDTPGHSDFVSEAECVLPVLDAAVVVISALDGVAAHTRKLFSLVRERKIPCAVFINKTDITHVSVSEIAGSVRKRFGSACVDYSLDRSSAEFADQLSMTSDRLMASALDETPFSPEDVSDAFAGCSLVPCFAGSALRQTGVRELMDFLAGTLKEKEYGGSFGAVVYKISRDVRDRRLTQMKITGGVLRAKDTLRTCAGDEKVERILILSGEKAEPVAEAPAGTVCAVEGLKHSRAGDTYGSAASGKTAVTEPVIRYLMVPSGCGDVYSVYMKIKELEEEDPGLSLSPAEDGSGIYVSLMGRMQMEVLARRILDRYGFNVDFRSGEVIYRETIRGFAEGIGHFEPLRHYAEVRVLIEEGKRGSGTVLANACRSDSLATNWQRLIMTHLAERVHRGVLTGSALTDVKITLLAGRAHLKHTEGGDFREAAYRAVRNALMNAESVLLEPYYDLDITVPRDCTGRCISDMVMYGGSATAENSDERESVISASVPVARFADFAAVFPSYTRGEGKIAASFGGYGECGDSAKVIEARGYDPRADRGNSPDSVFCANGAGFVVPWNEVAPMAHTVSPLKEEKEEDVPVPVSQKGAFKRQEAFDDELRAIFERTYGKIKPRAMPPDIPEVEYVQTGRKSPKPEPPKENMLLVDGYNIIHAWPELSVYAADNYDLARKTLERMLSDYQGYRKEHVILVFDAYRTDRKTETVETDGNITVIYTKNAETADTYIQRASYEYAGKYNVRVATSDYQVQLIVLGNGAARITPPELHDMLDEARDEMKSHIYLK